MRQADRRPRRRHGFTLVELLVSMALIIFIMALMSDAFSRGVEAFRNLKAIGDMQEKLRSVAIILRRDLRADHFDAPPNHLSDQDLRPPNGTPPANGFFRIWQGSALSSTAGAPYYREGTDDNGPPGIDSYRATDQILHFTVKLTGNLREDWLTARAPSTSPLAKNKDPANSLTPPAQNDGSYYPRDFWEPASGSQEPAGTHLAQWAEVAYFLRPTGQFAGTTPLYGLYRRQRLAVPPPPQNTSLNTTPAQSLPLPGPTANNRQPVTPNYGYYFEVSCDPDVTTANQYLYFNAAQDLTIPERRFAANQTPHTTAGMPANRTSWYRSYSEQTGDPTLATAGNQIVPGFVAGDDLLLTNVISFEIKALWDTTDAQGNPKRGVDFQDLNVAGDPNLNLNTTYTTAGASVFDTWTTGKGSAGTTETTYTDYAANWSVPGQWCIPAKIRVRGLQIIIRVWDLKTKQARQMTIVQDM